MPLNIIPDDLPENKFWGIEKGLRTNMLKKTVEVSPAINLSPVEEKALRDSAFEAIYPPVEKIPVIVVESFPMLGRLTALRFIEWVQNNPGGVACLATGKTPEYFIKWVQFYISHWGQKQIEEELLQFGINPSIKPDCHSLHLVQMDEFYPIESFQQKILCRGVWYRYRQMPSDRTV